MTNIQLICECCNKVFERSLSQYKYQTKKERKSFCSSSCSATFNNLNNPKIKSDKAYNIAIHASNRRDEFTGFREFITRINKRAKNNPKFVCNITLQDLKNAWERQKGICPYTGIALQLPSKNPSYTDKLAKASLDRIDSSKGYTKDNIQFMSPYINFLKSDLTQAEFETLISLIRKNEQISGVGGDSNPPSK